MNIVDLIFSRNQTNSHTAFYDDKRHISYPELITESKKLANTLKNKGVKSGDHVSIVLPDCIENVVSLLGVWYLGGVAILINPRDPEKVIKEQCELVDSILTIDEQNCERIFADVSNTSPLETVTVKNNDDLALMYFTSGTTGHAKAVMHTHQTLYDFVSTTYFAKIMTPTDRIYVPPKAFSAYGFMCKILCPIWSGSTALLDSELNTPHRIKNNIESFKPTMFFAVPVLFAQLIGKLSQDVVRPMRCFSAGDILPQKILDKWIETTGQGIVNIYGSTEFQVIAYNKTGTTTHLGPHTDEYEIRIVDENNNVVQHGLPGRLQVRGKLVTTGYYKDEYWTNQMFTEDGWAHTNDVVYLDEDNNIHHLGRFNDVIKTAKGWVNPTEIENVLVSHEKIEQAAVVNIEDSLGIGHIEAFIVPTSQAQLESNELKAYTKNIIGKHAVPSKIHFVEFLPRTTTGKLQRHKLREPAL
jgi:acyl-coenzyme A synthetase/AMP-(fatty) acid ligase